MRKEQAKPPNPTPTEGIGFWAAMCTIGLWMDEKRSFVGLSHGRRGIPKKLVGQGMKENPPAETFLGEGAMMEG